MVSWLVFIARLARAIPRLGEYIGSRDRKEDRREGFFVATRNAISRKSLPSFGSARAIRSKVGRELTRRVISVISIYELATQRICLDFAGKQRRGEGSKFSKFT